MLNYLGITDVDIIMEVTNFFPGGGGGGGPPPES